MRKLTVIFGAAMLVVVPAIAMDNMQMGKSMDMKMVDANGDGMISKDEFMKHHETMFEKMKKNSAGMVDIKDMGMMHKNMKNMHNSKSMNKDEMKKDGMAK